MSRVTKGMSTFVRAVAGMSAVVAIAANPAYAQQTRSLVAGYARSPFDTTAKSTDSLEIRNDRSPAQRRMLNVLGGAGIGAVLGATVGIVVADKRVNNATYLDHSEDGLVYIFDGLLGAAIGA